MKFIALVSNVMAHKTKDSGDQYLASPNVTTPKKKVAVGQTLDSPKFWSKKHIGNLSNCLYFWVVECYD